MEKGTGEPNVDDAAGAAAAAAAAALSHPPPRRQPPRPAEPIAYGHMRRRPRSPGQTFRGILFAIAAGLALLVGFMMIGTLALTAGGRRGGRLEALAIALLLGVPAVAVGVRWGWDALRELGTVRRR